MYKGSTGTASPRHQIVESSQIEALLAFSPGNPPFRQWQRRFFGPQCLFGRFADENNVLPLRESNQESSVLRRVIQFFIFYISSLLCFIIDICLSVLLSRYLAFCFSFPHIICFLPFLLLFIILSYFHHMCHYCCVSNITVLTDTN